eukprot:4675285-Prymnesium_polylepis.1
MGVKVVHEVLDAQRPATLYTSACAWPVRFSVLPRVTLNTSLPQSQSRVSYGCRRVCTLLTLEASWRGRGVNMPSSRDSPPCVQ